MCCIDVDSSSNTGNIRNAGYNNSSSVVINPSASTSIYFIYVIVRSDSSSSSSSVVCVQLVYLVPVLVAIIIIEHTVCRISQYRRTLNSKNLARARTR